MRVEVINEEFYGGHNLRIYTINAVNVGYQTTVEDLVACRTNQLFSIKVLFKKKSRQMNQLSLFPIFLQIKIMKFVSEFITAGKNEAMQDKCTIPFRAKKKSFYLDGGQGDTTPGGPWLG